MIDKFGSETALLVIDAQVGVNLHDHWGGQSGHRNNPNSEQRIAELLAAWREARRPVFFTLHNSREDASPLKLSLDSGKPMPGLEPGPGETVVVKDVNSGFAGTNLELNLRRSGVSRLVVAGYFTNMCVETTVRAAGNLGYNTYLAHDACAAGNRAGLNGQMFDAEQVHAMSVANLHGEFCTAIQSSEAIALLRADAPGLCRMQGNEPSRGMAFGKAA
jgi:nicotinamidase-related amidase